MKGEKQKFTDRLRIFLNYMQAMIIIFLEDDQNSFNQLLNVITPHMMRK